MRTYRCNYCGCKLVEDWRGNCKSCGAPAPDRTRSVDNFLGLYRGKPIFQESSITLQNETDREIDITKLVFTTDGGVRIAYNEN